MDVTKFILVLKIIFCHYNSVIQVILQTGYCCFLGYEWAAVKFKCH